MKYITWDTKTDLKLEGFEIEPEIVNGNLKFLTLSRDGQFVLKVGVQGDYYSACVLLPAPPVFKDKFKLSGKVLDLTVEEYFDEKYEAEIRKNKLAAEVSDAYVTLEVTEVKVPE